MRTVVYVDGFNLYFRLLEKRPQFKWLDLKALAQRSLSPANQITGIRYYTARVSGNDTWRHWHQSLNSASIWEPSWFPRNLRVLSIHPNSAHVSI